MKLEIDLKNYDENAREFRRTAVRGMIRRDDKYLLIHSKYGDYKFPGGGMEVGETLRDTLKREVKEETGFDVLPDSIKYYGAVSEKRKGEYNDILYMDSHYFFCEVSETPGERNLDEYEEEYEYSAVWLTLREALDKIRNKVDTDKCPWQRRDTAVMELLCENE